MNIFCYIKDLFASKNNLLMQVIIFSISGIIAICLNNCLGAVIGSYYESFLGYAPVSNIEQIIDFILAIMLILLMFSYGYVYSSRFLNTEGSLNLPEVTMTSYIVLIRIIPVIVVWLFYFWAAFILGKFLFAKNGLLLVIFEFLVLLLLPSVFLLLVSFSKDFMYRKIFFNPFIIFSIIKKYMLKNFIILIQVFFLNIVSLALVIGVFYIASKFKLPLSQVCIRILGLCIGVYLINIINLAYMRGCAGLIIHDEVFFK